MIPTDTAAREAWMALVGEVGCTSRADDDTRGALLALEKATAALDEARDAVQPVEDLDDEASAECADALRSRLDAVEMALEALEKELTAEVTHVDAELLVAAREWGEIVVRGAFRRARQDVSRAMELRTLIELIGSSVARE